MNIDNGTSEDLKEGMEITISVERTVRIIEVGSNYITVETDDGDEVDITDGSDWFITI